METVAPKLFKKIGLCTCNQFTFGNHVSVIHSRLKIHEQAKDDICAI